MINGFYVTDAHCHVYPDKIAEAATANTDRFYGTNSAFDGKVSTLLTHMDEAGVDHAVIESVATTPKQVDSINRFISALVSQSEGRFTGLGALHPESENIPGDIDRLIDRGLHGVKLHPDIQQFKLDDYRCLKMYEICEKKGIPVLIHTGDRRYDFSNPNRLVPVADIYTDLTVVAAHLGGYSMWEGAYGKLTGIPNLYFDCSSTFHWVDNGTVKKIIRAYGADKVLFGTDYPMWRAADELKNVFALGLTDEELKLILSDNAARVFGTPKAPA